MSHTVKLHPCYIHCDPADDLWPTTPAAAVVFLHNARCHLQQNARFYLDSNDYRAAYYYALSELIGAQRRVTEAWEYSEYAPKTQLQQGSTQ